MPANLSPEYKKAEAAYKQARVPKERLECLREMLRTIPKHKGTERLQAEIKTRIRLLAEELATAKDSGGRRGLLHTVHPEGAGQVALLGPPNSGKSTLHARLTGSHAHPGPTPFTTREPLPGMLRYQDIHFQLIDLPSIAREHPLPWIGNALQSADACLLVVDLCDPDAVDEITDLRALLAERHVSLLETAASGPAVPVAADDPFAVCLPTLLVGNKADRLADPEGELAVLQELDATRFVAAAVAAVTGAGLERIGPWLFETLGIVRVYTKAPGRAVDRDKPFTVRRGATVHDVADLVHGEIASRLRFARLWREGELDGYHVGRDHPVRDGDILELHA